MLRELANIIAHRARLLFGLALIGLWASGSSATATPAVSSQPTAAPTAIASGSLASPTATTPDQPTARPGAATPTPDAAPPSSAVVGTTGPVPVLDRSQHVVPLKDILFDTFGGSPRFIPLDEASDEVIEELRDAIRPIDDPIYGSAADLPWLDEDDLVIGYRSGGGAYAYPVNILEFHEIVNDNLGGVPVLITYCPLCFSGVVFSREVGVKVLTFGNTSALYQSDLVTYDKQTGSYWFQVGGEAVVGPLSGSRLSLLPSTTITWGEWRRLFPDSKVLTGVEQTPDIFGDSRYGRGLSAGFQDRINNGQFVFPVDENKLDDRLQNGEIVLTVEIGDAVTVFPLGLIGDGVANHHVGGTPVAVFARSDDRASAVFSRELDGRTLTFEFQENGQQFVDLETGSVWDALGRATSGQLAGAELEQLNTRRSFWFSVAIAFPDVEVYLP